MLPSNAGGLSSQPPVRHWPVSDPVEFQLGMGKPTLYAQVPPHVTFGQPVGSVSNDGLATKMVAANALGTKSNIPTIARMVAFLRMPARICAVNFITFFILVPPLGVVIPRWGY